MGFSTKQLDNFRAAALSLKLFSRAELNDEKNRSLIERLYVDPLPNDQVFKTLLANNTSIIVGRKGTGKSTIFQRVQHEIRTNRSDTISAYMDIRNVYEASQIDPIAADKIEDFDTALSVDEVQKLLLYKRFIRLLISDITAELRQQVEHSYLSRLKERVSGSVAQVFRGLDGIVKKIDNPSYENIDGFSKRKKTEKTTAKVQKSAKISPAAKTGVVGHEIKLKGSIGTEKIESNDDESAYTQIVMRIINVNDIILEIKNILETLQINNLYIFLDDFSELPQEAMKLFVDTLISPLTRWSGFIKFKIAAYPGRVYLGSIDPTKIEEINLDMYGLYGHSSVTQMEEKAINFVSRVVEKRIDHFCKDGLKFYFDIGLEDLDRILFYASMANPRILGHLMLYAHESNLIYGNKIGIRSIQEAAQKYYEEKIHPFLTLGKYRVAFEERSSIFSLKALLESIVKQARKLRQAGPRSAVTRQPVIPSSHFYVINKYDDILRSLELSFFVNKYFEQSDRDGKLVSVYALNYGLCSKFRIRFGRPNDQLEDRLYFVARRFDYNGIIKSYLNTNQEIRCENCNSEFPLEMLSSLKMYMMKCPKCSGNCRVVNLSTKYADLYQEINSELLLPNTELDILQTLNVEDRPMTASEIAGELDCSGQLIGRRGKNLYEKSLVTRQQKGTIYVYKITQRAKDAYFANDINDDLDVI